MAQVIDIGVTLSTDQLRVNPGEDVRLTVTVHNDGPEIDCFRLEVNGLDPDWWEFDVPCKPLLPHQDPCRDCTFQSVLVIKPPPNSDALARLYPLEVIATREQNRSQGTVVPVSFEVLPFYSFDCKLEADHVTGVRGDYVLEFSNTGNRELFFDVAVEHRDLLYSVNFLDDGSWERIVKVGVLPGRENRLRLPVSVQPIKQHFIGKPKVFDFTIIATPQERGLVRKQVSGRFNALSRLAGWRVRVASFLRRSLGTPRVSSLRMPTWGWIMCVVALIAGIVIVIRIANGGVEYVIDFQLDSGQEISYGLPPLPESPAVRLIRIKGNAQWLDSRSDVEVGLLRPDGSQSTSITLPSSSPRMTFTINEEVANQGSSGWQIRLFNTSTNQPATGTLRIRPSGLR